MSEYQNSEKVAQNQQIVKQRNGFAISGFIISLIAIFVGWIPFLGWFVWFLGMVLSLAGAFKKPKGMAIAGLVISLIGLIILISVFGVFINELLETKI